MVWTRKCTDVMSMSHISYNAVRFESLKLQNELISKYLKCSYEIYINLTIWNVFVLNECFLQIQKPKFQTLHLRNGALKIILECQLGYYGENCRNWCSVNCNVTRRCDRFTGSCNGGCQPGWTGNTCDQSEYTVKNKQIT